MAGAAFRLFLVAALAVCGFLGASNYWNEQSFLHILPTRVQCLALRLHPQFIWQPPGIPHTELASNIYLLTAISVL